MLFNREEKAQAAKLKHTTLADGPSPVSLPHRQDLASPRQGWCQLQRSLYRAGTLPAADGPIASDRTRRAAIPPGAGDRTEGIGAHRILCTCSQNKPST